MNLCTPLIYNMLAIVLGSVSACFWLSSSRVKFPGLMHDGGKAQNEAWDKASRRNGWGAAVMTCSMACLALAEFVKVSPWCR